MISGYYDHFFKMAYPWFHALNEPNLDSIFADNFTIPGSYQRFPVACPIVTRSWFSLKFSLIEFKHRSFLYGSFNCVTMLFWTAQNIILSCTVYIIPILCLMITLNIMIILVKIVCQVSKTLEWVFPVPSATAIVLYMTTWLGGATEMGLNYFGPQGPMLLQPSALSPTSPPFWFLQLVCSLKRRRGESDLRARNSHNQ